MELTRSYAHGPMALTVLLPVAGEPGSRCWSCPCNLRAGPHIEKCQGSVTRMDPFLSGGATSKPGYDCVFQGGDKAFPSMAVIGSPAVSLDRETRDCGSSVETIASANSPVLAATLSAPSHSVLQAKTLWSGNVPFSPNSSLLREKRDLMGRDLRVSPGLVRVRVGTWPLSVLTEGPGKPTHRPDDLNSMRSDLMNVDIHGA
jgi:hypothetical protein